MNNLELGDLNKNKTDLQTHVEDRKTSSLCSQPESIHFRCPHCSKRFSTSVHLIHVEKPEFTCSSCQTDFFISFFQALDNGEVIGVELPKTEVSLEESPSLDAKEILTSVKEDLEKDMGPIEEPALAHPLDLSWQKVLEDYESFSSHQEFIQDCEEQQNLDYALERYSLITDVNPQDQEAQRALKWIEWRCAQAAEVEEQRGGFLRQNYFYSSLCVLLGMAIMALGHWVLVDKNIIGLGMGLIFFTFAVRAFLQPRASHL